MTTAALTHTDSYIPRRLAIGLAGAAAFGAAAGLGHGALAMLRGAWMSPALFLGGALFATPPLYLASTWAASQRPAEALVDDVASVVCASGVTLLGLAAPVAFFSVTLRTHTAASLLVACAVLVGATAIHSLARRALPHSPLASLSWVAFAVAIGVRLIVSLAHHL